MASDKFLNPGQLQGAVDTLQVVQHNIYNKDKGCYKIRKSKSKKTRNLSIAWSYVTVILHCRKKLHLYNISIRRYLNQNRLINECARRNLAKRAFYYLFDLCGHTHLYKNECLS